ELGRRRGAVDPDVLGLEGHGDTSFGWVWAHMRVLVPWRCCTGAPLVMPGSLSTGGFPAIARL
ncbi:hypothetical protein NGM37_58545, partial [Streptomyces sp. TRM76130]|nr:hypothetical protein [Streptomyces sp. TRM76130]